MLSDAAAHRSKRPSVSDLAPVSVPVSALRSLRPDPPSAILPPALPLLPAELDASIFMGRLIHILPGKRPPPPPEGAAEGEEGEEGEGKKKGGTSSYKEAKEAQLKAGAGNRSAWNTLFMRADTVAEAVAAHFGGFLWVGWVAWNECCGGCRPACLLALRQQFGQLHVCSRWLVHVPQTVSCFLLHAAPLHRRRQQV